MDGQTVADIEAYGVERGLAILAEKTAEDRVRSATCVFGCVRGHAAFSVELALPSPAGRGAWLRVAVAERGVPRLPGDSDPQRAARLVQALAPAAVSAR